MPKYRKMLNNWDEPYMQTLVKLIETQSKETLINWAIDYSRQYILPLWLKHFSKDDRPERALDAAATWLSGKINLTQAKPVILECHAAARESDANPVAQAAARAIGQSTSTIHAATHCVGLVMYGALAIAYDALSIDAPWAQLELYAAEECGKMTAALRAIATENEPSPAKLNWKC